MIQQFVETHEQNKSIQKSSLFGHKMLEQIDFNKNHETLQTRNLLVGRLQKSSKSKKFVTRTARYEGAFEKQ